MKTVTKVLIGVGVGALAVVLLSRGKTKKGKLQPARKRDSLLPEACAIPVASPRFAGAMTSTSRYERALRDLACGDRSALEFVSAESRRRDEPEGLLISAAASLEPSPAGWEEIQTLERRVLDEVRQPERSISSADAYMAEWLDELRVVHDFSKITPLTRHVWQSSHPRYSRNRAPLAEGIRHLFDSPELTKGLTRIRFGVSDGVAIGRGPDHVVTNEHVIAIANSPHLDRIERIDLPRYNRIGDEAAFAIASSDNLSHLDTLEVGNSYITTDGMVDIVRSEKLPALAALGMSREMQTDLVVSPGITDQTLVDIGRMPEFQRIRDLSFRNTLIHPESAQSFAQSPYISGLRRLNLFGNGMNGEAYANIVRSPYLSELEVFEPSGYNYAGEEGLLALASSPHMSNLRELELSCCGQDDHGHTNAGIMAIFQSPYMANLERLAVGTIPLTYEGLNALMMSPHMGNLVYIHIDPEGLGTDLSNINIRPILAQRFPEVD